MASRQSLYQQANAAMGLCRQCGLEATEGVLCQVCSDKGRVASRDRYRIKKGIPLDVPLYASRNKRG